MSPKANHHLKTNFLLLVGMFGFLSLHASSKEIIIPDLHHMGSSTILPKDQQIRRVRQLESQNQKGDALGMVCELNLYFVPDDVTINCTELANLTDPVVMDSNLDCCDPVTLTLELDTIPGVCPVLFTLIRTWIVADECGDSLSDQQVITVMDNQAPIFLQTPPSLTVSCDAIPTPPVIGVDIQATDDCNGQVTITFSTIEVPGICAQQYIIMRTWVARDACQNSSYIQQTILVQDHQAPEFISPPEDMTIHCLAPAPPVDTIMAEDNCSQQVWFTFTESLSGVTYCNTITRVRTWTAEDMCGNVNTHTQTITQTDSGPPVLTNIPANTTAECGDLPDDEPSVDDDCDSQPLLNVSSTITPGNCPGNYTLIRTWTALDECGHSSTASQTITVTDTQGPVISFTHPLLIALANGDTMKAACEATVIFGINDAIVIDACDPSPQTEFIDSLIFDDGCKKLLYCEWRSTDFCGNVTSFIFYMLVGDFTGPVISGVPPNVTISCNAPIPGPGNPTVDDDCDLGPKLNMVETTIPGPCPQAYQIIRTWTANDFCGNISTMSQVISIVDNQAPVMTAIHPLLIGKPNNSIISVECGSEPIFNVGALTAVDNCDNTPIITIQSSTVNTNCIQDGYIRQITYIWIAVDDCGNQSTYTIFIRVLDTTPPFFTTFPSDITINCTQQPPTTQPTANDACSPPVIITQSQVIVNLACGYRIDRTWIATDQCGNATTSLQRITAEDHSAPILGQKPADITILCDQPIPPAPIVTATDSCDADPIISLSTSTIPGNCPGNYELIRTWTATDHCGNSSTKAQRITVQDNEPPVFITFPLDGTISCEDVPQGIGNVTAEDNCSGQVIITVEDNRIDGACPDAYFLARVFTADDGCGNTTTRIQKLLVVDEKPPVFGNFPPIITIECSYTNGIPTPPVTDNCDQDVTLSYTSVIIQQGQCTGEYLMTLTWTAVDNCNNSTTATQSVQVVDTTPPVITPLHPFIQNIPNGTEIIVECDTLPLMDAEDISAIDACDPDPSVEFIELVEYGNCIEDGFLYRLTCTWIATDTCGNSTSYTIYLRVVDTKPPVFTGILPDLTINVKNGEQIPAPAQVAFFDACDPNPVITFEEETDGEECGYILRRIWTATDACGNQTTIIQELTIIEGCPCQLPILVSVDIKDPKFGLANGEITIDLLQNESDYTFLWIPDLGSTNSIGNGKTGLGAGNYQVFIKDPLSDASCFIKVTVNLEMMWSCIDTVYISAPIADPIDVCIDSVLDYSGNTLSALLCGYDPNDIASISFNLPSGCLVIDPIDDFTGITEVCVIHCDDNTPAMCDTTYIFITITGVKPCEDLFIESLITGETSDCAADAAVCLPVPPQELDKYQLLMDGVPYSQDLEGCNFLTMYSYNQVAIPGGGNLGPYVIDSWTVNGQVSTGAFVNIQALVAWLNQEDPGGNWYFDSSTGQILGGDPEFIYGPLVIRQLGTNTIVSLGVQQLNIPQGTLLFAPEGEHLFTFTHGNTGCTDEIIISIDCISPPDSIIAIDDSAQTIENQSALIPVLQNDIIPGGILTDFFILTWPVNGTITILANQQILYVPNSGFCSLDSFTYVICNDVNCDTATVSLDVSCGVLIIHNGFSPNGDGINDSFTITGIEGFPENDLIIYNRWGNEVYKQKGYKNQWYGTWSGGLLPDGTYFYLLDDGTGKIYKGFVQLNR